MSKETDGAIAAMGCMGLIPALIFGYIIRAWAIVTLWAWFVTPFFHLAPPSYPIAIGLGMIGGMLTGEKGSAGRDKYDSVAASMAAAYASILLGPVISVFVGWTVRYWM